MRKLSNIFIHDELGSIIDSMRSVGDVIGIVDNADGTATVNTTKTYSFEYANNIISSGDLHDNDEITMDGITYMVFNVTNTSFDVKGLPTGTEWKKLAPYYYYGTPLQTEKERSAVAKNNQALQYPFIAYFDTKPYVVDTDPNNKAYQEFWLRIAFMDQANTRDWKTEDHYNEAIEPMSRMVNDFVYACRTNLDLFHKVGTYRAENFSNWGVVAKFIGFSKPLSIITEDLSGVELTSFNLITNKKYECNG